MRQTPLTVLLMLGIALAFVTILAATLVLALARGADEDESLCKSLGGVMVATRGEAKAVACVRREAMIDLRGCNQLESMAAPHEFFRCLREGSER